MIYMSKIIGFTYDLKSDLPIKEGDPPDLNAEFDSEMTRDLVKSAIEAAGHKVILIGNVKNLLKMLPDLKVDIIFNICEGLGSRNREAQVPIILEMYDIPYVGSDGLTMSLALDKILTKKVISTEGIPTPRYIGIDKLDDLVNLDHMRFPMIVKLRNEGTSKGLANESVVHSNKELEARAMYLFTRYNNPPLIAEELISGTEFTVPIIGNSHLEVLPLVQVSLNGKIDLGEMIYTFDRVSSDDTALDYICPAKIDKQLEGKLIDLAVRTYRAVDCRDFGRVDFRVDRDSNPYVLEINPLPSLMSEDVFNLAPYVVGSDYNGAVKKIIDAALERYGLN